MPIAMNQGVSFLVADMAAEIEASRLLTWQAAWMIDQGWGRKATKYSSFAKRFAADTAMMTTSMTQPAQTGMFEFWIALISGICTR